MELPRLAHISFKDNQLSPLIGLSEKQMRSRVAMLKRMKRLLIAEWHPVIDTLLADYERDLQRVELLRWPPDEPDVLDRDFDDGKGE